MKARLQPELGVAMAIALESSEADIRTASALLEDTANPHAARELAQQLLCRARRRVETVRAALGGASEDHPSRGEA
ncbi:MAG TPA: hypothetical protein VHP62_13170 [Usitatibacter sp.]|jgi:hypothetical protein|nr:hypothetical protein [Usitatibacter sp.]